MTAWGQPVWSRWSPPPTLCSCIKCKTLAIAPQSQRHVCQILWLARSLLLQSSRMSPFRRPVSAAKNSVPDSSFGDWFDDCVGSSRSRRPGFEREVGPHCTRNSDFWAPVTGILDRRRSYSGLSPSASNCRLHLSRVQSCATVVARPATTSCE